MTARELWDTCGAMARACLAHPFVQGIASGALARERFQVYVGQDAYFLEAFARAYGLALAKSPDRSGIETFTELLDGVFDELKLHAGYAERWGITLQPEPLHFTSAYTDFLLRTAALEPVGHTAAAMAPCMRLYAFLGRELQDVLNPESAYRKWVDTYAAAEFDGLACSLEALVDHYGGDPDRLLALYRRAMELELGFFQGAWDAV